MPVALVVQTALLVRSVMSAFLATLEAQKTIETHVDHVSVMGMAIFVIR